MSIRKAVVFVPRHLLASQMGPGLSQAASSATDATSALSRSQRDVGWAPLSGAAAASGAASPLGVAAVLVSPSPKLQPLVAKAPPVGWKPPPKALYVGRVASSGHRQGAGAGGETCGRRPALCCFRGTQAGRHLMQLRCHILTHRRKRPLRSKTVVVTSQTMHRAVLHLTADCRISAAAAPPPAATAHGGVHKRPSRRRMLGMLSRSLLLVGALLIAGMPPVLAV